MVLITERIALFDIYQFTQELIGAEVRTPKIIIVSPLIKSINYYVKASGVFSSIYGESLGDQLKTEDFVGMLFRKNSGTDMNIVTKSSSQYKYDNLFDMVNELEFLISLVQRGAKLYFYKHHKKYFLTSFGVITGSANYTPSGRYLNPESTFFFGVNEPTYKECLQDIEKVLRKAEHKGKHTIPYLQENLERFKETLGIT